MFAYGEKCSSYCIYDTNMHVKQKYGHYPMVKAQSDLFHTYLVGFRRGSMTIKLSFETLQICSSHKRVSIPLRQLRWLVRFNDPMGLCHWDIRFNLTRQANQGGSWLKPISWPPRLGFRHGIDNLSLWNRFYHRNTNNKSPTYCLSRDLKACLGWNDQQQWKRTGSCCCETWELWAPRPNLYWSLAL